MPSRARDFESRASASSATSAAARIIESGDRPVNDIQAAGVTVASPLSTMSRVARFCPACGQPLTRRQRLGALRPVCAACDHVVFFDPKVAVAAWILQDEHLLLVRRRGDPMAGYWAMPAGFMEYDEDPQDAVRREVLEETGLQVTVEQLLELFHTPADGGLANLVLVYEAKVREGNLRAGDDADAVAWFARDDLPPVAFLPTRSLIRRWRGGEL